MRIVHRSLLLRLIVLLVHGLAACSSVLGLDRATLNDPNTGSDGASGSPVGGGSGSRDAGDAGDAGQGDASLGIRKDNEVLIASTGLTTISSGGYLNGLSFQQDGVTTYEGKQYAAFWNTDRHLVLTRRTLPNGEWQPLEFGDYVLSTDVAQNAVSIGICPGDGTLHLLFDNHGDTFHYRNSNLGLLSSADPGAWNVSRFSPVQFDFGDGAPINAMTYARFVTEPGGSKLLLETRLGQSGNGNEWLWEYDSSGHAWSPLGEYIDGSSTSVNAYPHGLTYSRHGSRLHIAWCWRETPQPSTNHDLLYAFSDDNGRNWFNQAGAHIATTATTFITPSSVGVQVWSIGQNRGLADQEHLAVDDVGRVHVLLSHLPDSEGDESDFDKARSKSHYFHYWRDTKGAWAREDLSLPVVGVFRGKLAIANNGDVYAILPDLRIAAASAAQGFVPWQLVSTDDSGRFFSDPLIDTTRLLSENVLTVVYPQKQASNIYALDYALKVSPAAGL